MPAIVPLETPLNTMLPGLMQRLVLDDEPIVIRACIGVGQAAIGLLYLVQSLGEIARHIWMMTP